MNELHALFVSKRNINNIYAQIGRNLKHHTDYVLLDGLQDFLADFHEEVFREETPRLSKLTKIDMKKEMVRLNRLALTKSFPFYVKTVEDFRARQQQQQQQQRQQQQQQQQQQLQPIRQSVGRKSEVADQMEIGYGQRQRDLFQPTPSATQPPIPDFAGAGDREMKQMQAIDPVQLYKQHQQTYEEAEKGTFVETPQIQFDEKSSTSSSSSSSTVAEPMPQPEGFHTLIPRTSRNRVGENKSIPHIYMVNSRDRNTDRYPDSFEYRIDVIPNYKEVTSVELISAEIPKSAYIINQYNNLIYFEEDVGVRLIAAIPEGNYEIADLLPAIGAEMTATSTNGITYTASLNSLTDKITIASDAVGPLVFTLLFYGGTEKAVNDTSRSVYLPNSIGPIIGFSRSDPSGAFAYTADHLYDLSGEQYLLLHIFDFENIERPDGNSDQAYAKITLDVNRGEIKYYNVEEDAHNVKHFSPTLGVLSDMVIKFKRYDGQIYDFNGRENSLTFRILTRDPTVKQF